jgi:hypothetical protein
MTALALRGLVQSRGHEVRKVESSDTRCVYEGRRAGSDGPFERSVWTIDRARAMGLTGKDNWKRQPEAMLIARASSEMCRLIAADVLLGVPYSAEEIEDEATAAAVEAPRRVQRARVQRLPAPPPEPDLDDGPAPQEEDPGAGRAEAHQPGQADRPQRRPHRRPRPHRPQRETCVAHRAPRPRHRLQRRGHRRGGVRPARPDRRPTRPRRPRRGTHLRLARRDPAGGRVMSACRSCGAPVLWAVTDGGDGCPSTATLRPPGTSSSPIATPTARRT